LLVDEPSKLRSATDRFHPVSEWTKPVSSRTCGSAIHRTGMTRPVESVNDRLENRLRRKDALGMVPQGQVVGSELR
jgi:hypothetical protein